MAGRPPRGWERKTYTVSPEVALAVSLQAAKEGVDQGTVIDALIWNMMLKPSEEELKAGGLTDDQLERMFAEEVLEFLNSPDRIDCLSKHLSFEDEKESDLRQTQRLVKRWRTTRRIEKERQEELLSALGAVGWVPRMIVAVDSSWFQ